MELFHLPNRIICSSYFFARPYTSGSSPVDYVLIRFDDRSGQFRTATLQSSSSGLVITGQVDSNWLNGTYTITDVLMHDQSGRTTSYQRDGRLSTSPTLASAPTTHSVNFPTQDFQVTGAIPSYFSPVLTAIKRTSPSVVSPNDTINLKLTYTDGSSPVMSIAVYYWNSSGAERITLLSSPTSGGVATLTVAPDWLNGAYRIKAISLSDASGRSTVYQWNSVILVSPDLVGFPATHTLDFPSEEFQVTGGEALVALPILKGITRTSAATIKRGDSMNYQFTIADRSSPLHAAYVVLVASNGTIRMPGTLSPVSGGGMITATPDASWPQGPYRVREVMLEDATGRKVISRADGSVSVFPDLMNAPTTHSVSFSGLDFQLAEQPVIETQPQDLQSTSGASFTLSVQATGSALQYQWYRGTAGSTNEPIAGATSSTLTTQVSLASSFWVRISNIAGTVDSRTVAIGITATPASLAISTQPMNMSVNVAADASFVVQATGSGSLSYQWQRTAQGSSAWTDLSNGGSYGGVTSNTLTVFAATDTMDGDRFRCVVSDSSGSIISAVATLNVSSTASGSRLTNISTRSFVGTGADVQIAGFIISGNSPKTVILRASGPALTKYGVSGVLADPVMNLHHSGVDAVLGTNDDWDATSLRSAFQVAGIDNWQVGSKDAAMLVTLNPGGYTAVVSGKNATTGVALIEVYDVGNSDSKLVNISCRSLVKTGGDVQIAGFIISGNSPKKVIIRASGPALTKYGVPGVLADPVMEIHQNGVDATLTTNDDWDAATVRPVFQQIGIDNWQVGSRDAAVVLTLNPGGYTAIVSGKNNTSGVALVEVFEVN